MFTAFFLIYNNISCYNLTEIASSALVPDVKEEKASHPAFVEIRPVTSEIGSSTFRPDVIIHSGDLTVEIANTASEELLRKLRGIIHV